MKQEINDMNENFEFMSEHIKNSLVNTKEAIQKNTEEAVIKEHKTAADVCINKFVENSFSLFN